jgi:hypothetical protein
MPKTLIAAVATLTALLVATPAPSSAATSVLKPSLQQHLATAAPATAVRVLVQAGGSIGAAKRAVESAGLRLETTLDKVGIAVAVGLPSTVERLGGTNGVTRVDWADEPLKLFTETSHTATRAVPVQDGRSTSRATAAVTRSTDPASRSRSWTPAPTARTRCSSRAARRG